MIRYLRIFSFFSFILYTLSFSAFASEQLLVEPRDGQQPILQALQQAHSSIDLAMYGFTDPDLMQAFIQAKAEGKVVRILLQHFPYKASDENLLAIQRFSTSHLNYAFAPANFYLLHQKTLLLDHQLAFVMTFNFTRSTFKNERNFGLIIQDPGEVAEIQQVFDADWQHKSSNPSNPKLVWSPDNSRAKILALIESAKAELKMYAEGLSDYQVIGALAKAARQGVSVQIITSGSPPGGKWAYLQKAGVQFRQDQQLRIHAKVIIVDQRKAMLGSINFTQPSLDKNRELSVLMDDPKVVQQLLQIFQSDWKVSV